MSSLACGSLAASFFSFSSCSFVLPASSGRGCVSKRMRRPSSVKLGPFEASHQPSGRASHDSSKIFTASTCPSVQRYMDRLAFSGPTSSRSDRKTSCVSSSLKLKEWYAPRPAMTCESSLPARSNRKTPSALASLAEAANARRAPLLLNSCEVILGKRRSIPVARLRKTTVLPRSLSSFSVSFFLVPASLVSTATSGAASSSLAALVRPFSPTR